MLERYAGRRRVPAGAARREPLPRRGGALRGRASSSTRSSRSRSATGASTGTGEQRGARPRLPRRGARRGARGSARGAYAPGDLVGRQGRRAHLRPAPARPRRRAGGGGRQPRPAARGATAASSAGRASTLTPDARPRPAAGGRARCSPDKVGAIVALDPRNGEILRAGLVAGLRPQPVRPPARAPTTGRRLDRRPATTRCRTARSRAPTRPGSVFKIVIAAAGLVGGRDRAPRHGVFCRGGAELLRPPLPLLEAGRPRLGRPRARRSSTRATSTSTTLGQKLGIERIARYARLFGLGTDDRHRPRRREGRPGARRRPGAARCASTPGTRARRSRWRSARARCW